MGSTRTGRLAVMVVAVLLLAACGREPNQASAGKSDLADAIDRMASLQSVRMLVSDPDAHATGVVVDYQAPDRFHFAPTGTGGQESFAIGSRVLQPVVGRPGYFRTISLPPDGGTPLKLFRLIQSVGADAAVHKGDGYRLTLPGDAGTVTLKVEHGYVAELTNAAGGAKVRLEFSLFDEAPEVAEPPADHVLPAVPGA